MNTNNDESSGGWRLSRLFHTQDFLQILFIAAGVGGAVWTAAVWTNNWDRGLRENADRITKIEHEHEVFSKLDLPKQINMLTYRVDTGDGTRLQDIASRKQFETDVRVSLDKISEIVVRLQIRLGDAAAPINPIPANPSRR